MAALQTRFEITAAADKKMVEGSSRDMDTSMTVLGKRSQTEEGAPDSGLGIYGNIEKRPQLRSSRRAQRHPAPYPIPRRRVPRAAKLPRTGTSSVARLLSR